MGNCVSKTKSKNTHASHDTHDSHASRIENHDINLHGLRSGRYPPINYRKVKKSGLRIGAHVDIGFKDFEAGATFGRNSIEEINFSENNNHLKLLKSFEGENDIGKDQIIASLINLKNEQKVKPKSKIEEDVKS